MRIRLIAVGTKMPGWITEGFEEYRKRLTQDISLELVEIPAGKRGKNADVARITEKEGDLMLAALHPAEQVVCLDVKGQRLTTEKLAQLLEKRMQQGNHVALLIGGPEGLAPQCRAKAQESWSLSDLTLPHPLVRVLVAEQIYRAWSILKGHPYHR